MTDQPADELNFDRAIPLEPVSVGDGGGLACANCKRAITDTYYLVNGQAICGSCRERLGSMAQGSLPLGLLAKGLIFGLVGTIAGALVYWAAMRADGDGEWPIVALASGWIIAKAMHFGTDGRGSRILQVSGGVLVIASVALAHFPFNYEASVYSLTPIETAIRDSLIDPLEILFANGPMGILFAFAFAFGIAQPWQQLKPVDLRFEGPFKLGSAVS